MLKPTKYTNLQTSVVSLAAEILKIFSHNKVLQYDDLFRKIIDRKGKEAKENFLLALNFLFLLGKIEYYQKGDLFEYRK